MQMTLSVVGLKVRVLTCVRGMRLHNSSLIEDLQAKLQALLTEYIYICSDSRANLDWYLMLCLAEPITQASIRVAKMRNSCMDK